MINLINSPPSGQIVHLRTNKLNKLITFRTYLVSNSRGAFPVSHGVMLRHDVMVRGDDQMVVVVVLVALVHVAVTLNLTLAEVGPGWK